MNDDGSVVCSNKDIPLEAVGGVSPTKWINLPRQSAHANKGDRSGRRSATVQIIYVQSDSGVSGNTDTW